MSIKDVRSLFPVTRRSVYLNNAAETPMNERFRQRLMEFLQLAADAPQDTPSFRDDVRALLSRLFGGSANEYALMTSTVAGVGTVAAGLQWKKGQNVVLPSLEHWSNIFPWFALKERGVEIRLVDPDEHNRVTPEAIAKLVDENTKVVALAAVRFNSGFRADLKRISAIAHRAGALLVVDGIQAAGVVPLNVDIDGIDVLCCGGFKWLLGAPGTGFMYVRKEAQNLIKPVIPGMWSAGVSFTELKHHDDARRYESGTIADSLFYAWTAGLELLLELGVENIHARVMELTDYLIKGLRAKKVDIVSPVDNVGERSAIVIISVGSADDNKALYKKLRSKDIIVTLRLGVIRVSPNFFNTENDIDALLEQL
jgi:cysteine desulfurase / selenocysteine lyase